ncbi:MAG: hypothetical protein K9J12_12665 [Melioribacteraceae bacterium]|nr:hypothetical protein [Melioribacteraceae bacterium]MCF8412653.1 hypothetical protein [Melioribacteraceae bacterium]MCF8430502.1 hypothetical protein [Melioribacteraceae bacterium]
MNCKNYKLTLAIYLFVLFSSVSFAQDARFDSLLFKGMDQIYGIEFEAAQKTFDRVKKEYPNHPAGLFFESGITWWKILLDLNNEELDDLFYDQIDETIDFCDEILDSDPMNEDALFFKGGSLGFRGRLLAIREEWLSAALDGKDALPLIHNARSVNPDNPDLQLGFGIYNYYTAVIPTEFPMVKPFLWFLPPGDKELGLKQIENVAFNGKYAKYESMYFLAGVLDRHEKDYDGSLKFTKLLLEKFPNNPRFESLYARVFIRKNDWESGVKHFRVILEKCNAQQTGYINKYKREALYYVGVYEKNHYQREKTVKYLEECLKLSLQLEEDREEESGFTINCVLYLGMMYDANGEREKAIRNYEQVLDYNEHGNSHILAEKYLKEPYQF